MIKINVQINIDKVLGISNHTQELMYIINPSSVIKGGLESDREREITPTSKEVHAKVISKYIENENLHTAATVKKYFSWIILSSS